MLLIFKGTKSIYIYCNARIEYENNKERRRNGPLFEGSQHQQRKNLGQLLAFDETKMIQCIKFRASVFTTNCSQCTTVI